MSSCCWFVTWRHTVSQAPSSGNLCSSNKKQVPCIRSGMETMIPGQISLQRHCLVRRRRWQRPCTKGLETGKSLRNLPTSLQGAPMTYLACRRRIARSFRIDGLGKVPKRLDRANRLLCESMCCSLRTWWVDPSLWAIRLHEAQKEAARRLLSGICLSFQCRRRLLCKALRRIVTAARSLP